MSITRHLNILLSILPVFGLFSYLLLPWIFPKQGNFQAPNVTSLWAFNQAVSSACNKPFPVLWPKNLLPYWCFYNMFPPLHLSVMFLSMTQIIWGKIHNKILTSSVQSHIKISDSGKQKLLCVIFSSSAFQNLKDPMEIFVTKYAFVYGIKIYT